MAAGDGTGDEFDVEAWMRQQLGQDPEPPAPAHPDIPTQAMDLSAFDSPTPPSAAPLAEEPVFRSRRELRNAGAIDASLQGTEALGVPEAIGVPVPDGEGTEPEPSAGLDAIFGAGAFQDYEDAPLITRPQAKAVEVYQQPPREGISRTQKVMLSIAGGLVGALALVALFLVGTRISGWFGPSPAVIASPTPSPTPSATALPLGPLAPGTYAWDELLGTECLESYESPWEENYTVVDCTQPHAAQMVKRGTFTEDTVYPGLDELASRMNLLCTDPTVIDYAQTAGINDLQFAASYAPNETEWDDGQHDYFCFVNRSGGEPLTVSIAKPPVAPVAG